MAKKQIFKSFAELAENALKQTVKQADDVVKTKRPRIIKKPLVEVQKVEYTPQKRYTSEEVRIHNAWNKYKNTGVYATMPEEQGYKLFLEDWDFKHDPSRMAIKDLNVSLDHLDNISGTTTPSWMRKTMAQVVSKHPQALRTDLPSTTNWRSNYTSNPAVSSIPDYFKPQQYRGIGNIDSTFENAASMSTIGANNTASQFASAGLSDVAAMALGLKPTSFKYKATSGIVPRTVLEEIAAKRNAPAGTVDWLTLINAKNPEISASYLDLFAKHPTYFRKMFNLDGSLVKYKVGGKLNKLATGGPVYNGIPYRDFNTSNYDYFGAYPDNTPTKEGEHWASRNPVTGQLLKREDHPTYDLMINGEKLAGQELHRGLDGNLYSVNRDSSVPYPYRSNDEVDFSDISTTRNRPYDQEAIEYINQKLQHLPNELRAVIIGNIIEESGGNPFAKSNTEKYQGLLQWGPDRYRIPNQPLSKFELIDQQLDYLLSTLNDPYDSKSWTHGGKGSGYKIAKDAYTNFFNSDLWGTHHAFSRGYVRPEGRDNSAKNRFEVVKQIMERYN